MCSGFSVVIVLTVNPDMKGSECAERRRFHLIRVGGGEAREFEKGKVLGQGLEVGSMRRRTIGLVGVMQSKRSQPPGETRRRVGTVHRRQPQKQLQSLVCCLRVSLCLYCVHVRVFICVCSMQQVGIRKSPATVLFASQQLKCENVCVVRSSPV